MFIVAFSVHHFRWIYCVANFSDQEDEPNCCFWDESWALNNRIDEKCSREERNKITNESLKKTHKKRKNLIFQVFPFKEKLFLTGGVGLGVKKDILLCGAGILFLLQNPIGGGLLG